MKTQPHNQILRHFTLQSTFHFLISAAVFASSLLQPVLADDKEACGKETAEYFARAAKSPLTKDAKPLKEKWITLKAGDIEGDIIGNAYGKKPHCSGYNGISRLLHKADRQNLFVDFYAGMNFEHIWDGTKEYMEPRKGRLSLWRFGPNSVGIYRSDKDSGRWHMESMTRFTFVAPHYIDVDFTCIPRKDVFENDYIGMFWASYMNGAADSSMKFLGRERNSIADPPGWISAFSPKHNVHSTHIPSYDSKTIWQGIDMKDWPGLAANFSAYENTAPFYFGRVREMVWAVMFKKKTFNTTQALRFSQSPTGGGGHGYPAWDFHFLIRPYEINKSYGWYARCLYKPFVSNDDVLAEYNTFSGRDIKAPNPGYGGR